MSRYAEAMLPSTIVLQMEESFHLGKLYGRLLAG